MANDQRENHEGVCNAQEVMNQNSKSESRNPFLNPKSESGNPKGHRAMFRFRYLRNSFKNQNPNLTRTPFGFRYSISDFSFSSLFHILAAT
jgi:hypothetical protein